MHTLPLVGEVDLRPLCTEHHAVGWCESACLAVHARPRAGLSLAVRCP